MPDQKDGVANWFKLGMDNVEPYVSWWDKHGEYLLSRLDKPIGFDGTTLRQELINDTERKNKLVFRGLRVPGDVLERLHWAARETK